MRARHRVLYIAASVSVRAAIFGPDVLSTSPSVIYYSPVIDQCESPWHPCKTRSRNMETLVATMTNYFGTKRLRFSANCIGLIKIYNERVTRLQNLKTLISKKFLFYQLELFFRYHYKWQRQNLQRYICISSNVKQAKFYEVRDIQNMTRSANMQL